MFVTIGEEESNVKVVTKERENLNKRMENETTNNLCVERLIDLRASRITSSTEAAASNSNSPQEVQRRLQKKTSTHYNALKRKDLSCFLKPKLVHIGNAQGPKQRHQEFVTLWNAQCDSHFPKSAAELARQNVCV